MKYIIEIEEIYHGENHPNSLELYRVKNFHTLVFDHYGLNQLERLEEHDDKLITKLAKNYTAKKHGKWNPVRIVDEHGNEHPFDGFQCSNCGNIGQKWMQYCFNCGARMDGDS